MRKRILSFMLILSMLATLITALPITASAATSGTCGDNLTWTLDDEGTLTISGTGDMENYFNSLEVPWYSSRTSIKTVDIQTGVTSIGDYAFYGCSSLTRVTIPDKVTSIGDGAFRDCSSLTSVTIPDDVRSIGRGAFRDCSSLTSVTIGNSVTSIGDYTFYSCKNLTSIKIPNSVTSIGIYAFEYCKNLVSVTIGNSVTNIGYYAFYSCKNLINVTIGNSVTNIGDGAFRDCSSLTSVTIPNSVTSIGDSAFDSCKNLTSVIISDSVTSIGDGAFIYCRSLTDVYYTGSEENWNDISISSTNYSLIDATIHYNCVDKSGGDSSGTTDSIKSKDAKELNFAIYQNKNDSSKTEDSYILATKAIVTNGVDSKTSDSKGLVSITNTGNDITVSKKGYLTRKLTAKRAAKSKKIYLQQNKGDRPIIQAVWIDNIDVYTEDYEIDITSTESVTLEAEVVWKSGSQSRIYLMQNERRVEFSGTSLTTVLSDNFDVSDIIYIVAEDTDGNVTKKKLKFKASGSVSDVLNDYKLSLGDSITGTIPSSIPVLGGSKVGLDLPMIPLTVTFEDNKFYAVLGLDVAKASKKYSYIANINGNKTSKFENETKYLFKNIKDSFTKSADKYSFSKLKSKWMKAKYNYQAKFGFDADLTVIGYLEGYVDSSGNISILDGGAGVNPFVKWSVSSQIMPVPPLYWEAELKGEIEALVSIYLDETAKNFTPNGSVEGDVTLKGGVGLGVSGVAGISGGAEGNIGIDWDIYFDTQDYFAVSGKIGAYVKAFTGPITWIDKSFPFAEGIIWDYPSTRVNMLSLADEIDLYDTSGYALIDRSYAEDESYFVANDSGIMLFSAAAQNKIENTLKTNIYTYSEPKLVEFSDGTILAVWLDDDTDRSAINRTTLLYSYYNGEKWSNPRQVDNDGTGDYSPDLKIINDTAYITWVNADVELRNDAQTAEMFSVWEISAAVFDKTNKVFTDIATVTDNSCIDMSPHIFGDESGIQLVWAQNSADDIFCESNTYSIMTSTLSGGEWDKAEVYASGLMPIDSLDGYKYNGNTYISYTVDLDGDQQDYTDKEIYLNNTRITGNEVLDSKPVFANNKLYYYSDGTIVEYDLSDNTSEIVTDSISTDRFSVISDGENSAIIYGESNSLTTELCAVMYDAESDKWGESIKLTALEANISSYSGIFSQDGEMKFVINKTEVTGDINSENPYGQTDLAMFTVTSKYNLSIGDAVYHEELLLAGNTLEFYTEITNNGELTVNDYMVQVVDKAGNILAKTYNEDAIYPGETVDFTAYYPLGNETFVPHDVTLKVVPINAEDYDESDNVLTVSLNCENISLENLDYGIDSNGNAVIYGDVVNRGYSAYDSVMVTLYKDNLDGEAVETVTIEEKLNTLDLASVSFTVPFETDAVYYVEVDGESQDSDFVVLQSINEDLIRFNKATNTISIDSTEEITDTELLVALYQNGRLIGLKSEPISIAEGENIFNSPITDYTDADTIKIMILEDLSTLKPAYDACTVEIK